MRKRFSRNNERNMTMAKVRYAIIGFGGIAENRVAKEGYACDKIGRAHV